MRDASLKQTIPCILRISIYGAFSAEKNCTLYMGKYGIWINTSILGIYLLHIYIYIYCICDLMVVRSIRSPCVCVISVVGSVA